MSALYSIQDILSPTNLLAAYKRIAGVHTNNSLFTFYNAKTPEEVDGRTFEFAVFDDTRTPIGVSHRGAPARTIDAQDAEKKTITPIHAFNELTVSADSLEFLRQASSPSLQKKGMEELRRQMELFVKRHSLMRAVSMAHAFRGTIYYDGDGMPLESSSGAAVTVDLGVGATHKSQLAHASNGGSNIIGTTWSNAAASILTDLEQIRFAAEYDKVPTPRHVWLHSQNKTWIINNTEIKAFVQYNNPQADQFLKLFAGMGDSLSVGDWTFHFINSTYIGADNSTVRPIVPTTAAIITPDVNDGDWFAHVEASETIPKDDGVIGSLEEYFEKTNVVYGDFAYARIADNPLKVTLRMGSNFLYAFKDPNAVWYPTVSF